MNNDYIEGIGINRKPLKRLLLPHTAHTTGIFYTRKISYKIHAWKKTENNTALSSNLWTCCVCLYDVNKTVAWKCPWWQQDHAKNSILPRTSHRKRPPGDRAFNNNNNIKCCRIWSDLVISSEVTGFYRGALYAGRSFLWASVRLSNAWIVTKRKHLAKKVQLWLIGSRPRPRAFQWA